MDYLLFIVLILLGVGLSVWIYFPRTVSGSQLEIRIDGVVTERRSLSEDCKKQIQTPDGGSNWFEIKNGTVYMREADCHDKICVGMHGISKSGETIVCLPHKLVLAIVSTEETPASPKGSSDQNSPGELDAVTGK